MAEQVLRGGVDLVELARVLSFSPDLPNLWQSEWNRVGVIPRVAWDNQTLSGLAVMADKRNYAWAKAVNRYSKSQWCNY